MKIQTLVQFTALFFAIFLNSMVHSQIVNDNCIPANALINWSNAGLLPNSRTGGLEPVTPMQADRIEIVTSSYPLSQIQGFISNAPANQTTVIYFPGGIYYLSDPIESTTTARGGGLIY